MASIFDDYKPAGDATAARPPASPAPASSGSGIFKDYTPAARAPASAVATPADGDQPDWLNQNAVPTLGQMSVLEKPDDVSYGDFVRAHLAEWARGGRRIGQAADDYVRAATNAFGVGDRVAAYLSGLTGVGGGDLAAQRAQTAAANERLGPVAYAANMTGYGPVSALRIAPRAADAAQALTGGSRLAGWGAGAAASGAESAASAGLGTLGHGGSAQDAKTAAEWAAVLGLGTGALGVASARTPSGEPTLSAAEAEAARDMAYAPMSSVQFHPNDVDPAYTSALLNLGKEQRAGLSDGIQSTLREHLGQNAIGTTSASDIDGFARGVSEAALTNADKVVAGRINQNLRGVLENATPVSGHALGVAAQLQDGAQAANARFKNAQMLEEWRRQANLPTSGGIGEVAPGGAYSELKASPQFYSDPDVNAAMRGVAGAGSAIPGGYLVKHALAYPLIGAGLGALGGGTAGFFGAAKDENQWTRAAEEALMFGGGGLAAGYGAGLPVML
jgi:hypothetical protein